MKGRTVLHLMVIFLLSAMCLISSLEDYGWVWRSFIWLAGTMGWGANLLIEIFMQARKEEKKENPYV